MRGGFQCGFAHFKERDLDGGAEIFREGGEHGGDDLVVGGSEAARGFGVGPDGLELGGEDTVGGFGEGGEFVAEEILEGGGGGFEDEEVFEAGFDAGFDEFLSAGAGDFGGGAAAGAFGEGVRVGFAGDGETRPAAFGEADFSAVDVGVGLKEMFGEEEAEGFGFGAEMLFGQDVHGVLHGVRGDDEAVIGLGVGGVEVALKGDGDIEFFEGVNFASAEDFQDADAGFAVLVMGEFQRLEAGAIEQKMQPSDVRRCSPMFAGVSRCGLICELGEGPDRGETGHGNRQQTVL